ncbi:MAG: alpha/beta hydrolase, partial [Pikeienuella sp.]
LLPLMEAGYGLAMMEYRGSGATKGPPGETRFAADARALYDQLDQLTAAPAAAEARILHGFSLGSGVAVRLAAERRFAAVMLEASYPRLCRYFERRNHGLPLCALMWRERYDAIDRIAAIDAPKLFIHGAQDQALPLPWAEELFAAAGEPKRMEALSGGGHADLAAHGLFPAIFAFLAENGL